MCIKCVKSTERQRYRESFRQENKIASLFREHFYKISQEKIENKGKILIQWNGMACWWLAVTWLGMLLPLLLVIIFIMCTIFCCFDFVFYVFAVYFCLCAWLADWQAGLWFFFLLELMKLKLLNCVWKKNTEWLVAWFVFYNVRMWVCVRVYVRVCAFGWRRCWILLMMTMMAMVIMMMIVCKYWWCWHFKFCFFFSFSCYCVIFTVFLLFISFFFLLLLCYTKFIRFFTLKNLNLLYKRP